MPDEVVVDAFEAAVSAAEAEVGGEQVDQGQAESIPQATEPTVTPESVAPSVEEGTTPPPTQPEAAWWEGKLDDKIQYKGVEMTLGEALAGGLRQSDYTRKTQELARKAQIAEWGETLLTGLRSDPVKTLRDLAEQMKLIPQGQQEYDPAEEPDPAMVEIHGLRSEVEELREARLVEEARREIAEVRGKYSDFSDEVLQLVAEYGTNGVGLSIEEGYFLWKGRQSHAAEQAAAAAKAKAEAEAAALTAARQAQVAPGHSQAAGLSEERDYGDLEGEALFDAIAEEVFGGLYDD